MPRLLGDDRHGERIPLGHAVRPSSPSRRRSNSMCGAIGHAVRSARSRPSLSMIAISPLRGERQAPAALVRDGRHVAILDRAVGDRLRGSTGLVDLRRAADVEGTHRQLRARLTDRLRRDHADRFADVHRRTAGEVAPVALAADAHARLRRPAGCGS